MGTVETGAKVSIVVMIVGKTYDKKGSCLGCVKATRITKYGRKSLKVGFSRGMCMHFGYLRVTYFALVRALKTMLTGNELILNPDQVVQR